MGFLREKCTFKEYNEDILKTSLPFNCGADESSKDLNDFFVNDALNFSDQLLGKSYCFILDDKPETVVCIFTLSNDSINVNLLPGSRKKKVIKKIPREKIFNRYPAVLIGRLGVNELYQGEKKDYPQKIADELMNFIKAWFVDAHNKTGCRFIVVDAYNAPRALKYYENNGFQYIFSSEEQEKEQTDSDGELKTRLMFFDLIVLKV